MSDDSATEDAEDERHRVDEPDGEEEIDEQFRALMEGLRTTLPGVTVLFGFLLALPFQASFASLETNQIRAYYIAFATAAISSLLLIAPSVHQRFRSLRTGIKRRHHHHVIVAVRLTIVGTITFLISMASSVYLVTELLLATNEAALAVAIVLAIGLWAWVYLPLVSFAKTERWSQTHADSD